MIQLSDAPPGPQPRNDHGRGWVGSGLIALLALAGASLPAQADTAPQEPPVAALSGSTLPPAAAGEDATPAVAAAMTAPESKPVEAGRPRMDERQRRALMLMLINRAGAVRPYGTLGR